MIEDTHYPPTTEYIKKYGQCFVFVTMPDGDRHYYGVFSSGLEALAWMDKQYKESQFRGSFACVRLRTPDRVRTHEDWYAPERLLTEEEFNAEYPTPINQQKEKPMTNTIISDYEVTTAYIKQNIDAITEFARSFISNEPSKDEDIFHSFNNRVDLNFVLDEDTQNWNCYAYPVVNGTPSYDQEYEVHIPVDVYTYKIVRNYHPNTGRSSKVILEGLTLQEAKAYCRREDTRKEGEWFDGYEKEAK